MTFWQTLRRPPWRTLAVAVLVFLVGGAGWALWSPGQDRRDGRHDRGHNGLWMQHGWLGDDGWFKRNHKWERRSQFRAPEPIAQLAARLKAHHITDVFPHLSPAGDDGRLPPVEDAQVERFLDALPGVRVMPWVGGVLERHCFPGDPGWRRGFVTSVKALLEAHPRLAGVQVNIEPWPSGQGDLLRLLEELRAAMPAGKLLSIAAYPPPTRFQPNLEVHWEEGYYHQVARRVDQLAVMMYDSSLASPKLYRNLMAAWTEEVLEWSGGTPVLLGVPTYQDEGVGYHHPEVENLENALLGIHAGLERRGGMPASYQGVAVYCEWETDEREWRAFGERFLRR